MGVFSVFFDSILLGCFFLVFFWLHWVYLFIHICFEKGLGRRVYRLSSTLLPLLSFFFVCVCVLFCCCLGVLIGSFCLFDNFAGGFCVTLLRNGVQRVSWGLMAAAAVPNRRGCFIDRDEAEGGGGGGGGGVGGWGSVGSSRRSIARSKPKKNCQKLPKTAENCRKLPKNRWQ